MLRSIISIIVASALIVGCAVYENLYLKATFDNLNEVFMSVKSKIDDENCDESDVIAAQKRWLDKKKKLHVFIPHTEIKEVDLWVSECVAYARAENYEEAAGKIEVILELFEQIPKTFLVRIENLL